MRGWIARPPLVEKLTVLVENLNPAVLAVIHKNSPRHRVDGEAVHTVEIAGTRFLPHLALLPPGHEELTVLVELGDAGTVVPIRHEHGAIGKPAEECWPVEVPVIGSWFISGAEFEHHLLSVVRKFVHLAAGVLDHPHVLFRIVGVDVNRMRPPEKRVPLRPVLDDVALSVQNVEGMFPAVIDSLLSEKPLAKCCPSWPPTPAPNHTGARGAWRGERGRAGGGGGGWVRLGG